MVWPCLEWCVWHGTAVMVMHGGARRGRHGLVWQSWFCALRPVADGLMRSGMAVLVRQGELRQGQFSQGLFWQSSSGKGGEVMYGLECMLRRGLAWQSRLGECGEFRRVRVMWCLERYGAAVMVSRDKARCVA